MRSTRLATMLLVLGALGGCVSDATGEARPIRGGETVTCAASLVGTWSIISVAGQLHLAPATKGTIRFTPQGQFEIEGECRVLNAQGRSERRPIVTSGSWRLSGGVLVMRPLSGRWSLRATCTGEGPERVRLVDVKNFKMSMVRLREAAPPAPESAPAGDGAG